MLECYQSVLDTVGRTPLVRLSRLGLSEPTTVLAKLEGCNPSGSSQARVALGVAAQLKRKRNVGDKVKLISATSGTFACALAMVAAVESIPLKLIMPNTVSRNQVQRLMSYGAEIEFTLGSRGMQGAQDRARAIVAAEPEKWFLADPFANSEAVAIHYTSTGPEIWEQAKGRIDVLVVGVGSGATITGVGRYLKQKFQKVKVVAVEPEGSAVLEQTKNKVPLRPGGHKLVGLGPGFVPPLLDFEVIDQIEKVSDEEALHWMSQLTIREGIPGSPSSGGVLAVALRIAKCPEMFGKAIVAILPDFGIAAL